MEIEMKEITIREIVNGYVDNNDEGVVAYGGKLNVRPPYQREFCYSQEKQESVIHTIMRNYPLNVMYWAKNNDGTYEIIDGQQRTISFCKFLQKGGFSIPYHGDRISYFYLNDDEKQQILDYKIMVYICEGTDIERLDWFKTINISGEHLEEQELLNAQYTGTWLHNAKQYFSKRGCPATEYNTKYLGKDIIRQGVLETAIAWVSGGKKNIREYMEKHQNDENAMSLWLHFKKVMDWVVYLFPKVRKEMKGLDWGRLFVEYGENTYNVEELEQQILDLMADEDVTSKKGIYEYVLSKGEKERFLSIRTFSDKDKSTAYARQNGCCKCCGKPFDIKDLQADHIIEWSKGGHTTLDNLQMVCSKCHKTYTREFIQS